MNRISATTTPTLVTDVVTNPRRCGVARPLGNYDLLIILQGFITEHIQNNATLYRTLVEKDHEKMEGLGSDRATAYEEPVPVPETPVIEQDSPVKKSSKGGGTGAEFAEQTQMAVVRKMQETMVLQMTLESVRHAPNPLCYPLGRAKLPGVRPTIPRNLLGYRPSLASVLGITCALIGYGENNAITWLCGGSLISERYVLSAAHCNDAGPKRGLARWVRLGDYNAKNTDDDEMGLAKTMKYEIIERIIHPEYLRRSVYNDIALYKLEKNVEFNEYVRPICLQTKHQFAKSYVIGAGWDPNERLGKNNGVLQKVNLTITPRKQCSEAYESVKATEKLKSGIDDASMVCAVDKENADPCLVDAGGPIMIRLTTPYCMYSQVGIASFGTQCSGNRPGVYTRVSRYVPWIESIVWP
ncbi:serine-type endopeptidase activity protein [Homalodisca vitripennis]|nr:serine-type endopeptidase activity protein [Homalodisca vitripennis]